MHEPDLITVARAIEIIDATPASPRVERVRLEGAQGLRLACDVVADRDYPPFNKSLMDGYAVRTADVRATPVELDVTGEVAAGSQPARAIGPGEAMAVMTGAPVPAGADGVVPVEDVLPRPPGDGGGPGASGRVRILRAEGVGKFITPRGADCAAGTTVLPRGTKLEASQLAVAASVGAAEVDVYARPRVGVLSTGDELVPVSETPGPAQIRNSNNVMLAALMRRLGCDVTGLGIVLDLPAEIRLSIQRALAEFDVLLVSGGMSMGQYDYVPRILAELGVELKVTKLRIKPGKPFVFGVHPHGAYVFGLPGNPVSGFVCALRLASRLVLRLGGGEQLQRWVDATLEEPVEANGTREFYQPAVLGAAGRVRPLKWRGSADIYTLARANALIVRPENAPALSSGANVRVMEVPS